MRSILCLTPSSLAFVLGGAHFWRAGQYRFSVGCMLFALLVWRREAWIRQVTLVLLPLLAALGVGGGAVRAAHACSWNSRGCGWRASCRRVALFTASPAGRRQGGCASALRGGRKARSCGRRPLSGRSHPDAAARLSIRRFLTGVSCPDGRHSISCLPGFGPRGWHRGLGTGMPRRVRLVISACSQWPFLHSSPSALPGPVPHDQKKGTFISRAGHDPRGPAIPWRRAVHAHSVRRLRTAGRGCVVQPPVLFRGLG